MPDIPPGEPASSDRFALLTLGNATLLSPDGGRVGELESRHKRFAVLVYLAVESSGAPIQRDTLFGVFWPDSTMDRARNALRQSLHVLRRHLGSEAILSRGQQIEVDSELIWCDAPAFRRALERGDRREALSLYRGDFLDGVHLSGSSRFERWTQQQRRDLRLRAASAAGDLADELADSDPETAIEAARRAVRLTDREEPAVRRLLRLLAVTDRLGEAREVYERLQRRLRERLGAEPAEETRRLARAIREKRKAGRTAYTGRAEEGDEVTPAGNDGPESPTAESPPVDSSGSEGGTVDRADSTDLRFGRWAAVAGLLILAAVVGLAVSLSRTGGSPPEGRTGPAGLAILPFDHSGESGTNGEADDVAILVATALQGSETPFPIAGRSVSQSVAGHDSVFSGPRADSVARRFGVAHYVTGTVFGSGDRIRVEARVRTVDSEERTTTVTAEGTGDSLFSVVDRLARDILRALAEGRGRRTVELAARTTESLPAIRAYLTGERYYRNGRYPEAIDAFRSAVREDSSFGLAHYRLSTAANWVSQYRLARRASERALRYSGRLSVVDRKLIRAWNHHLSGRIDSAKPLYEEVVTERPAALEAWYQLAEIDYHWEPQRGRSFTRARPRFRRVLRYDPDHVPTLYHLTMIAAALREGPRLDSLAARTLARDPGANLGTVVRTVRAFASRDGDARSALVRGLRGSSAGLLERASRAAALYAGDLEGAARVAQLRTDRRYRLYEREHARATLAQLETARGRPGAAREAISGIGGNSRAEQRALLAVAAGGPVDTAEAVTLRRVFQRTAGRDSSEFRGLEASAAQIAPYRRQYLLGLVSVALGDLNAASRHARRLDRIRERGDPADGDTIRMRIFRPVILRAMILAEQGSPAAALAMLGPPRYMTDDSRPRLYSGYPKAQERWLRARLHRELGEHAEAARWFGSFPDPSGYDLRYLSWAHFERARSLAAAGDSVRAASEYRTAAGLWEEGNRAYRRRAATARRRAEALSQ